MTGSISLRRCASAIVAVGLTMLVAACGGSGSNGGASGKKVYMLLPNTTTVRFVSQDGPKFKAALEKALPGTSVIVQNAEGDPSKQVQQVETAISGGADAIVLVAADPFIAGGALQKAKQAKVPVLLYDHDARNGEALAQVVGDVDLHRALAELGRGIVAYPELRGHQVLRRALGQAAPLRRDLGQRAPAVPRVRPADNQSLPLQPVDDVGDAGRVHHQPLPDQPHRQRARPAEADQDQRLVPREGQPVRPELAIELGQQDLLRPHDRGRGRHGTRVSEPALPDLRGAHDRIKRQIQRLPHSHTVPPPGRRPGNPRPTR